MPKVFKTYNEFMRTYFPARYEQIVEKQILDKLVPRKTIFEETEDEYILRRDIKRAQLDARKSLDEIFKNIRPVAVSR